MRSRLLRTLCLGICSIPLLVGRVSAQNFSGVLTGHNDSGRTGQNLSETLLTPQNVNMATFGKVFSFPVDGQIFAQPLYVPNVVIPNQGMHNVLYVATENDSVYAFDADGLSSTPLWHVSFIDAANGMTTLSCNNRTKCSVYPIIGITSTPVIDPNSGTLYVVAQTSEQGTQVQRLHALDITTGAEKFGGPVAIKGWVRGTGYGSKSGQVVFADGMQRASLLLLNGVVYIAWATTTHGWVMGYNSQSLTQTAVFNTTADGVLGGVWQAGAGLASDSNGFIYLSTGDGVFDFNTGGVDYGDTVLKMDANLNIVDYFTPMDQACRQTNDLDLASGGPMVLPSQSGPYPDLLLQAGKGGSPCDQFGSASAAPIYLLNRDFLGGYNSSQDFDVQTVQGAPAGYWGSPAYWQGSAGTYVYFSGVKGISANGDYLKMYSLSGGVLSTAPVAQSRNLFPVGSTPAISANGQSNGVVWAIARQDALGYVPGSKRAILYAYDATNVGTTLYSSSQAGSRDTAGLNTKFMVPTIANGRVYVGTQTEVDVYGLFSQSPPLANPALSSPNLTFTSQPVGSSSAAQSVTLANNGTGTLSISSISATGDFGLGSTATSCPYAGGPVYPGSTCTIDVIFTPSQSGTRSGSVNITDNISPAQAVTLTGSGSITTSSLLFGRVDSTTPAAFHSIAVGDFNGDGKLDVVGASSTNGTISVLLGKGDGTLTVASTTGTGNGPAAVIAADFNGDGKLDAAVVNTTDNTVAILLGNGDGTFVGAAPSAVLPTGHSPVFIVKGDWNSDGKQDLAIVNSGDNTVSVFLGNGDGTFTPEPTVGVGAAPTAMGVGDFNGDGKPDLAVANSSDGTVTILLGNGDGTFTPLSPVFVGSGLSSLTVGDWNGDHILDLAVLNSTTNTIGLLIGHGDGTFTVTNTYATGNGPQSAAAFDYNSDGILDLAFSNLSDNTLSVMIGNGDGTFQSSMNSSVANGPCSIASGDFNGDGQPDLAVASCSTATVSVLLQVPQLTLSSNAISLGNQALGTSSSFLEVTLTNTGSAPLTLTSFTLGGTNPGDFTISQSCGNVPATLLPGITCKVSAAFAPTAAGARSAVLSIGDNANGGSSLISLTGTGTAPAIGLSAASLTFGNELVGTASRISSVILTNSGNALLAISSISATGDFTVTSTSTSCPYSGGTVNRGASCTIDTIFTPTQTGARNGAVNIAGNATPPSLTLTGNGTATFTLSPSLSFPVVVIGTSSAKRVATLVNNTNASTPVTIAITGTNSADFSQTNTCNGSLAAWSSCAISVAFTPSATGSRVASLTATDNGVNSPQSVPLIGVGTAVAWSPKTLSFGSQGVGTSSNPQVVSVQNDSTTLTVNFKSITVGGANGADFTIGSGTNACQSQLLPGNTCTINVTFSPRATGARAGTVIINDNAGGPVQTVTLNGTGT